MSVDHLDDIPLDVMLLDWHKHEAVIERAWWERLGAYNASMPTGVRPGRVWRAQAQHDRPRGNSGPGGGQHNYIFVVDLADDDSYLVVNSFETQIIEPDAPPPVSPRPASPPPGTAQAISEARGERALKALVGSGAAEFPMDVQMANMEAAGGEPPPVPPAGEFGAGG